MISIGQTFQIQTDRPSPEELARIIRESGIKPGEGCNRLYIKTLNGFLDVKTLWGGYKICFPDNCNHYNLNYKKDADKKVAEWICKEWDHLCWNDFRYVSPSEFTGTNPQTLDELCVFHRNLRQKPRVYRAEKEMVASRFLDLIFAQAKKYADILGMPFHKLHLFTSKGLYIAWTNFSGAITYNANYLYDDADSIRQTLVHELCHSVKHGHGKEFSRVMEEAMLTLKLISRPCAYSDKLINWMSGARFPTGKYCPGYDFIVRGSGYDHVIFKKISLWKEDT